MAIASLEGIEHEFEKLELLRGVNLELSRGERVALIGANGSGKTTLFRILTKEITPTHGRVFWAKGLRIAYLAQQPRLDTDQTVRQVARRPFGGLMDVEQQMRELSTAMSSASGDELGQLTKRYSQLESEHAAAGGFAWEYRVEEVLAGLGFSESHRELPCRVLSGGQQCRLSLACVLLSGAELLLLDEPTNHLDLQAVQWLEKYLAHLDAGVLLVSHDRYLLDRVVNKVYELRNGAVEIYPGNYSNYVKEREIRRLNLDRQFTKDQAYIAKERDFIARFHASGSRSREARGRLTRLERRLKAGEFITDAPTDDHTISLRISAASRGSDMALRLVNLSKSYGPIQLFNDVTLDLTSGQKMAVLGANGVGKTTMLRIAMGDEQADSGLAKIGAGMTVGYYDQKQTGLDDSLTVLEQMRAFTGSHDERVVRGWLARFLFRKDMVYKLVGTLSGGERSRLLLARLFYSQPNFLILDEPTNHLDIASREMLEQALCEYDGTVLLVSHDRYFIDQVCGRTLFLWQGRWELVEGNYTYWQMLQEEQTVRAARAAAQQADEQSRRAGGGKKKPNQSNSSASKVGGLNTYQLSKLNVKGVEEQIHKSERRLVEIEKSFADPAVFIDAAKLTAAQEEYEQVRQGIEQLMEVWQAKMEE